MFHIPCPSEDPTLPEKVLLRKYEHKFMCSAANTTMVLKQINFPFNTPPQKKKTEKKKRNIISRKPNNEKLEKHNVQKFSLGRS